MKKQAKTIFLILGIVLIGFALMGTGIGDSFFSVVSVYKTCDEATSIKTYGAQAGECFVNVESNIESLRYVLSVNEKTSKCTVTPACPDGNRPFCSIDTSTDWSAIFTCEEAYKSDGTIVKVCKSDDDCTSQKCVNAMCRDGLPSECSATGNSPGDGRCFSTTQYNTCLSNGRWSGILQCPSGTQCYNGICSAKICDIGQTKCIGENQFKCTDSFSWTDQGKIAPCKKADTGTTTTGGITDIIKNPTILIIIGILLILMALLR